MIILNMLTFWISSIDENMDPNCNNNHTLSRFISRMLSKWYITPILFAVISRSRPSAQVCLESLWIHRASIPRSSASRPKPIATNRLVDFIERKKLQVHCRFKLLILKLFIIYIYDKNHQQNWPEFIVI